MDDLRPQPGIIRQLTGADDGQACTTTPSSLHPDNSGTEEIEDAPALMTIRRIGRSPTERFAVESVT
jgi:hypothetical protein